MKLIGLVLVLAIGLALFVASQAGRQRLSPAFGKLQISASFYPLYFFANEIGRDNVDVINITPAGTQPHDYEPTPQDIASIEQSRVLLLNGKGFEPWAGKMSELLSKRLLIVQVAEELADNDPHAWLDPVLAQTEVDVITEALSKVDSTNSNVYRQRATSLKQKLDDLDKSFRQGLANCRQTDIITAHAAFGRLARRYGLNQVTIAGVSPDEEPSAQQLATLVTFAQAHNIRYIFVERLVNPKLAETLAQEIGAQTLVLDPVEGLSDDQARAGKDYFTLMKENLKNLQTALVCQA